MVSIKSKVQDAKKEKSFIKLSMMSKIVNILFKIRFIPVKKDEINTKVLFKLCSIVTLTFIAVYWGLYFLFMALYIEGVSRVQDVMMEFMMRMNAIDNASMFAYGILVNFFPLCPLFLGHALPSIPTLILAKDLKWPKHGAKYVASIFLCVVGSTMTNAVNLNLAFEEKNVPDQILVLLCIFFASQQLVVNFCWAVPALLVTVWMEKFICLCECKAIENEVKHTNKLFKIYSNFDRGFGKFFFFVFGVSQIFVIFSLFLTISQVIGSNGTGLDKLIFSFGNLSVSCGLVLNIVGLTFILDAGHKSMKGLANKLQDQLLYVTDEFDRQSIENIIKEIEKTGPLNGIGFFNITRGTLTGMASVGITYLIILVQFKMSVT